MTMRARCPRGSLALLSPSFSRHGRCRSGSRTRSGWSAADRASGCASSISPAPGYLSSPRTGAGAWSRRRKATWRAFPSAGRAQGRSELGSRGRQRERQPVQGVRRRRDHAPAGRLRISWQDDQTLKLEFDAGTQTRLLNFDRDARSARREDAGRDSRSRSGKAPAWGAVHRRRIRAPPVAASCRAVSRAAAARAFAAVRRHAQQAEINSGGHLKVVTTNFREGYLRKNGVPYSEQASITEYIQRLPTHPNGDSWLHVLTIDRRPEIPERDVLHEHELQAGAGRIEVQSVGVQDGSAAPGQRRK